MNKLIAVLTTVVSLAFAGPAAYGEESYKLEIKDNVVTACESVDEEGDVKDGRLVIPNGVVEIADDALSGMEGVFGVEIPNSVKTIGAYAFAGCADLWFVDGGDGLVAVGEGAFEDTPFIYGVETMDDYDEDNDEFDLVWVGV